MTIRTEEDAIDFVSKFIFHPCISLQSPCVPTASKVRKSENRYKLRAQMYDEYLKNLTPAHEAHTILCAQLVSCDYNDAEKLAYNLVLCKKILQHLNECVKDLKTQLDYIIHIEFPLAFTHDKHHIELFDFAPNV
jgi:hypothetical protein